MGLCVRALVNQVLCEETFPVNRLDTNIPIGAIVVPPGSTMEGQTYVHVLECEPVVDVEEDQITVRIVVIVQEELTITTPLGLDYPLEFAFRTQEILPFSDCHPSQLNLTDEELLEELECRVTRLSGTNEMILYPSNPPSSKNASFDQLLELEIHVELLQESQLMIALCPPTKIIMNIYETNHVERFL